MSIGKLVWIYRNQLSLFRIMILITYSLILSNPGACNGLHCFVVIGIFLFVKFSLLNFVSTYVPSIFLSVCFR